MFSTHPGTGLTGEVYLALDAALDQYRHDQKFPRSFRLGSTAIAAIHPGSANSFGLESPADRHDQLPIYDTLTIDDPEWVDEYLIYEGIEEQIL